VKNRAAPLAVGIDVEGRKEILGIWVETTEGARFWLRWTLGESLGVVKRAHRTGGALVGVLAGGPVVVVTGPAGAGHVSPFHLPAAGNSTTIPAHPSFRRSAVPTRPATLVPSATRRSAIKDSACHPQYPQDGGGSRLEDQPHSGRPAGRSRRCGHGNN
jgi:hypothetical protein